MEIIVAKQMVGLIIGWPFLLEFGLKKSFFQLSRRWYEYYQNHIKPKPNAPKAEEASGAEKWVCKICGYVHEGPLPEDFVCPWCKHPAEDFEKVSG